MSVEVKNLTKFYGAQKAVDALSFSVERGDILGFLGPNGAGKTTTMKMLTSYILPSSGQALISGFDVVNDSLETRKRIGYLPENNPLYKEMYIREYLEHVGKIYRVKNLPRRIDEMIEITGLGPERKKKINEISKGFKQRVGLAQAMIHDPEVLIMDEPTSGLDPNQLIEIRQVIRNIGKEKAVILSSHIMQEVEALCNRVIIINQGKLVADDHISAFGALIKGEQIITVQFRNLSMDDVQKFEKIPFVNKIFTREEHIIELHADGKQDVRDYIFDTAVKNNLRIIAMQTNTASMEEIFHQLTVIA